MEESEPKRETSTKRIQLPLSRARRPSPMLLRRSLRGRRPARISAARHGGGRRGRVRGGQPEGNVAIRRVLPRPAPLLLGEPTLGGARLHRRRGAAVEGLGRVGRRRGRGGAEGESGGGRGHDDGGGIGGDDGVGGGVGGGSHRHHGRRR